MLSEKQLNDLLEIFLQRTQRVTEEYLIRMGEQIQEIGELIPSEINRLVQLKRMNANLDAVKREIARLAEISVPDLEKILKKAMETDARFVAKTFGNEYKPAILNSPALIQILKAQLNVTLGEFVNISRTTISSEAYQKAIDTGISAVQSGMEDYNKAIRRALTKAAEAGIRVKIGKTGAYEQRVGYGGRYTKRLDSAVRQNVLDGIRSLSNDVLWQLGEEYGADGVEISAHATCAEDHLPYQGRQYSMEEFEKIQSDFEENGGRPFGMWNCRHSIHPILLGISKPAYSEEDLEDFKRRSTEKIEIDGVTKTRYQWTQEQRKIETAVRRQKDVAICARAAGNAPLRREAQRNIEALYARYDKISEKTGLSKSLDRLRVDGYKPMSKRELKKTDESAILKVSTGRRRNEEPLTLEQVNEVTEFAISLGMPEDRIVYSDNMFTSYFALGDRLYIGTDVYPASNGEIANSLISYKGAIGHEIIGHRNASLRNTTQKLEAMEEAQASIRAAKFTPGLSDEDREHLWQDARDRLTANGIDFEKTLKQLDIWEV